MFFNKRTTEDKFAEFRQKYDEFMKWTVKQAGKVMQEQEDFDEDELYGLATTALKKSMDLAEAALDAQEQQFETIQNLLEETKKAKEERDEIMKYLRHLDTKTDGIAVLLKDVNAKTSVLRDEKMKKEK